MTGPAAASVVIVSRHRPAALLRCLAALRWQDHPQFEVIVVADPVAVGRVRQTGLPVKLHEFDEPNISAARNLGLLQASAPVVAFIDDDAVAEPTWLGRLIAPLAAPDVVAAGGYVRARNGISFQWKAMAVDTSGTDHALVAADGPGAAFPDPGPGRAVKTQGTNCAFQTEALRRIGGFDPALHFYLDEADVNLRLRSAGRTAVVPGAEVHHGFAASARRRADRVPLTLAQVAASQAVFLRRHAPEAAGAPGFAALRAGQRERLLRRMVEGAIEPSEVGRLLATLDRGWSEGMARSLPDLAPLPGAGGGFLPFSALGPCPGRILCGRALARGRLIAEAQRLARQGIVTTVFSFGPTALAHRMVFRDEGFWMQTGGLFGASDRQGPALRLGTLAQRCREETRRIAAVRPTGP